MFMTQRNNFLNINWSLITDQKGFGVMRTKQKKIDISPNLEVYRFFGFIYLFGFLVKNFRLTSHMCQESEVSM